MMLRQHLGGMRRLIFGAVLPASWGVPAAPWLSATLAPQPISAARPGRPQVPNRISQENALPGTDAWGDLGNYSINTLAAYNNLVSVNAGSPINVHVMSTKSQLRARLYRMGYYQDLGGRLYAPYTGISTPAQRHRHAPQRDRDHDRPPPTATATSTATPTGTPGACTLTFNDVPPGSTFYDTIQLMSCRGYVNGYPCGGPGEPCPRSFFRPNNTVGPGEPWLPPNNRAYFRPNNSATRGQVSKFVTVAYGGP